MARPLCLWILTALIACSPISIAQNARSPKALETSGIAAMARGDFEQAETDFRALTEIVPSSFIGPYNLAAALAQQGEIEPALHALTDAIIRGFTDRHQLETDPDLDPIRVSEHYTNLLKNWGDALEARRNKDLARASQLVRVNRERRTLEELRLEIVSAHDAVSTDQAVEELEEIAGWAIDEIFEDLEGVDLSDQAWVFVTLPERVGFMEWVVSVFGPGARGRISSIGGAYEHQQRRLVAQDLGATLRHEFIHVLHWRDMSRRGQVHAAWVQEGLASLVEDTDRAPDGSIVLAPSWRTNMVKRLRRARGLPTLEQLTGLDLPSFTGRRPLARYAHARVVFMYLHEHGKLGSFYTRYTETYDEDPTGLTALTEVLGTDIKSLERDYRSWIDALPEVPETGTDLDTTMGISVKNGTGDGVVVVKLPYELRDQTGLRMGSVITAINGRPTRDLHELIRVLGSYSVGERIELAHRWGRVHHTGTVTLQAR